MQSFISTNWEEKKSLHFTVFLKDGYTVGKSKESEMLSVLILKV